MFSCMQTLYYWISLPLLILWSHSLNGDENVSFDLHIIHNIEVGHTIFTCFKFFLLWFNLLFYNSDKYILWAMIAGAITAVCYHLRCWDQFSVQLLHSSYATVHSLHCIILNWIHVITWQLFLYACHSQGYF